MRDSGKTWAGGEVYDAVSTDVLKATRNLCIQKRSVILIVAKILLEQSRRIMRQSGFFGHHGQLALAVSSCMDRRDEGMGRRHCVRLSTSDEPDRLMRSNLAIL